MNDPSSCSPEDHERATLAYKVYVDRLMMYITGYLCKLYGSLDKDQVDGVVFSGGIGEKSDVIRADVCRKLEWAGIQLDEQANKAASKSKQVVTEISGKGSGLAFYVVKTDEEDVVARMSREALDL